MLPFSLLCQASKAAAVVLFSSRYCLNVIFENQWYCVVMPFFFSFETIWLPLINVELINSKIFEMYLVDMKMYDWFCKLSVLVLFDRGLKKKKKICFTAVI